MGAVKINVEIIRKGLIIHQNKCFFNTSWTFTGNKTFALLRISNCASFCNFRNEQIRLIIFRLQTNNRDF